MLSMQVIWWAAIISSLLLIVLDAVLDSLNEDRDYDAMHARMKFAIYFMFVGVLAKAVRLVA